MDAFSYFWRWHLQESEMKEPMHEGGEGIDELTWLSLSSVSQEGSLKQGQAGVSLCSESIIKSGTQRQLTGKYLYSWRAKITPKKSISRLVMTAIRERQG